MSSSLEPSNYDTSKTVDAARPDCRITVGFDRNRNRIPRFLVRLHHQPPDTAQWTVLARFDHNETSSEGHDIYREGLHIDARTPNGGTVKLHPRHAPLPRNRGAVIRSCVDYLRNEAQYFIDVFGGRISPGGPPGWPDGGDEGSPHRLMRPKAVRRDMAQRSEDGDPLSPEELTELLAAATGTTPAELDEAAESLDIDPPDEAEVVTE